MFRTAIFLEHKNPDDDNWYLLIEVKVVTEGVILHSPQTLVASVRIVL